MAPVPNRRQNPTTAREAELLADLTDRLHGAGLTTTTDLDRREIIARQPAVTGDTTRGAAAFPVGLSQVVYLTRHRAAPDVLAWVIKLDDGFRGTDGAAFERIADGDDLDRAAYLIGCILATVDDQVDA